MVTNYNGGADDEEFNLGTWIKYQNTGTFKESENYVGCIIALDEYNYVIGKATWSDGTVEQYVHADKITFSPSTPDSWIGSSYTSKTFGYNVQENTNLSSRSFTFTGSYKGIKSSNSIRLSQEGKGSSTFVNSIIIKQRFQEGIEDKYYLSDSPNAPYYPNPNLYSTTSKLANLGKLDVSIEYTGGIVVDHLDGNEIRGTKSIGLNGIIYLHRVYKTNGNYVDTLVSQCTVLLKSGQIWDSQN